MKKIVAFLLAFTMIFGTAGVAFADNADVIKEFHYGGDFGTVNGKNLTYTTDESKDFTTGDFTFTPKSGYDIEIAGNTILYNGKTTEFTVKYKDTSTTTAAFEYSTYKMEVKKAVTPATYSGTITVSGKSTDKTLSISKAIKSLYNPGNTGKTLSYVNITGWSTGVVNVKNGNTTMKSSNTTNIANPDNISFVPVAGGTTKATITAYDKDGKVGTATVNIKVTDAGISASVAQDETLSFSDLVADINTRFDNEYDENFKYVTFTLPASSTGKLWFDYQGTDEAAITKSTKLYYKSNDMLLKYVDFVPKSTYSGTFTLNYTAVGSKSSYTQDGTISITVTKSEHDIATLNETIAKGETLKLSATSINKLVKKATDSGKDNFEYIYFTSLPSSKNAVLWYDYDTKKNREEVETGKSNRYYRDEDPEVDDLTLIPASSFTGTMTLEYVAYVSKSESYSGKIVVKVGGASTGSYDLKDIAYNVKANEALTFSLADFTTVLKAQTSSKLDYVTFTLPKAAVGTLLYGYTASTGRYSAKVYSDDKFYRSPGKNDYGLGEVSFLPASGVSGVQYVEYTAVSLDEEEFTGRIAITVAKAASVSDFIDMVPTTSPYYKAIDWAVTNNIATGTSANKFEPNRDATRAEIVYFIWNMAGQPSPRNTSNPFVDIKTTDVYYTAVLWGVENGVVYGTDTSHFTPDRTVRRGEASAFLYRYQGSPAPKNTKNPFKDIPATYTFHKSITWGWENGIIAGFTANEYKSTYGCTRAQILTFLYRYAVPAERVK